MDHLQLWQIWLFVLGEIAVIYLCQRTVAGRALQLPEPLRSMIIAPGTILHESAHALMCLITRTKILKFAPYWPQKQEDGTIRFGYVRHNKTGPVKHALIAIAPVLLVPPILILVNLALLGSLLPNWNDFKDAPVGILIAWAVIVGLGARSAFPSPADHPGAKGLGILFGISVVILGIGFLIAGVSFLFALGNGIMALFAFPAAIGFIQTLIAECF